MESKANHRFFNPIHTITHIGAAMSIPVGSVAWLEAIVRDGEKQLRATGRRRAVNSIAAAAGITLIEADGLLTCYIINGAITRERGNANWRQVEIPAD